MFSSLFDRFRRPPPKVDAEHVARLRCLRCGGEYESWDGRLYDYCMRFMPPYGKIFGCIVRYCRTCRVGGEYYLTKEGLATEPGWIVADELPSPDWLQDTVPMDFVREQLQGATDAGFRLRARMFLETLREGDEVRQFCSDSDAWNRLAGRMGYAIVRDGTTVAAIVTVLS